MSIKPQTPGVHHVALRAAMLRGLSASTRKLSASRYYSMVPTSSSLRRGGDGLRRPRSGSRYPTG